MKPIHPGIPSFTAATSDMYNWGRCEVCMKMKSYEDLETIHGRVTCIWCVEDHDKWIEENHREKNYDKRQRSGVPSGDGEL